MSKKKQTIKPVAKPLPKNKPIRTPIRLNSRVLWALLGVVFALFCFSVFKNIQYPLFWADESMTVVGAQRVLSFGYPKVHDGKNVFYDLRHTDPKLGIDEKTDAYVGGTSWGHYYYATIGVKIAEGFDDIYTKTGIIRFTFAFIGVLGLVLLVFFTASLFSKIEHKLLYSILFFALTLFSVSLALLLRETRYYSLSIFLFSLITGIYIKHTFSKPINSIILRASLVVLLWAMFMTFAPVFFITIAILGISEFVLALRKLLQTKKFIATLKNAEPVITSIILAFAFVFPFLSYFKTFEISEAMAAFNGYGKKMYWENIETVLKYFKNFELLWLALALKFLMLANYKSIAKYNANYLWASSFSLIIFVIYLYLIARVPNFIYTRYIILLQPILVFAIAFDAIAILVSTGNGGLVVSGKAILVCLFIVILVVVNISGNIKYLKGHITELFTPYKGPLDYTIPAIKQKYTNTKDLIIAANYEETSYMYYLDAKVIVGFIGNNLEKDAKLSPDLFAYRKGWGNYIEVFQGFMKKAPYIRESYPVYDNPVNNIPELNFLPAFNHKFESVLTTDEQGKTELYFRK